MSLREVYGVSAGPAMVAVQLRRLSGEDGKAEIPGAVDSMSCISSVWRLHIRKLIIFYDFMTTQSCLNFFQKGRFIAWGAAPLCDTLSILTTGR